MKSISPKTRCVKRQKTLATIVPASVAGTVSRRPIFFILLLMLWQWLFPQIQPPPRPARPDLFQAALDLSLRHGYHAIRWEVAGC